MNSLWQILKRFFQSRWLLAGAVLCTVVSCLAELYLPGMMSDIIDCGVLNADISYIRQVGIRMMGLAAVMSLAGYLSYYLGNLAGQRLSMGIRVDLYDRITRLSLRQVEETGEGTLVTRLSSDTDICSQMASSMIQLVIEPLILVAGGFYMICRVSAAFGLMFALFAILQIGIMICFIAKSAPLFLKVQTLTDRLNGYLQAIFSKLTFVKISTGESGEKARFARHNEDLRQADYRTQRVLAWFNPLLMLVMNASILIILLIAGFEVENSRIAVGDVMAVITWSEQILLSIVVSGELFRYATEAIPSAARIMEIMNMGQEKTASADRMIADGMSAKTEPGKSIDDISNGTFKQICRLELRDLGYADARFGKILEHCDAAFEKGMFYVVTGAVGCGKTTLARLLIRLYENTSGRILINGQEAGTIAAEELRRHMALVENEDSILSGSFMENLCFGRAHISEEDAKKASRIALCADYIEKLPQGYDTHVNFKGTSISGGERQRLLLARALAGAPDVLILDDALSALDYFTENRIVEGIRREYPDMMILLFTQRKHSAKYADQVFLLEKGGLKPWSR